MRFATCSATPKKADTRGSQKCIACCEDIRKPPLRHFELSRGCDLHGSTPRFPHGCAEDHA
eukprot:859446-Lingulodinium_polyedra.AAC.1